MRDPARSWLMQGIACRTNRDRNERQPVRLHKERLAVFVPHGGYYGTSADGEWPPILRRGIPMAKPKKAKPLAKPKKAE
jgi:hypothetical protein